MNNDTEVERTTSGYYFNLLQSKCCQYQPLKLKLICIYKFTEQFNSYFTENNSSTLLSHRYQDPVQRQNHKQQRNTFYGKNT
jgi:hypothetical protein